MEQVHICPGEAPRAFPVLGREPGELGGGTLLGEPEPEIPVLAEAEILPETAGLEDGGSPDGDRRGGEEVVTEENGGQSTRRLRTDDVPIFPVASTRTR
jgi:hypothetical protein